MRPTAQKRPAKRRRCKNMFVKRLTPKLKRILRVHPKGTTSHKPKVCLQSNQWMVTSEGPTEHSTKARSMHTRKRLGPVATSSWTDERSEFEQVLDQFENEESDSEVSEHDSFFEDILSEETRLPPRLALEERKKRSKKRTKVSGRREARSLEEEGGSGLDSSGSAAANDADDISGGSSSKSESESDEELLERSSFSIDSIVASGAVSYLCEERSPTSQVTGSDSAYKVFLVSKQQLLAVLKPPVPLCLVGRAHLSVLYGALTVDGHLVTPSRSGPNSLLVQSGFLSAPAHLHPIQPHSDSSTLQLRKALSRLGVAEAWGSLRPHLTSTSAVVLLERVEEQWTASQLGEAAVKLLPRLKGPYLGLGFKLRVDQDRQPWRLPLATLARRLSSACSSPDHEVPRVVVCGRQNSGKSTLLRTLVNSLLNVCPEVLYLDCDPGQSEFTPSATLSLTRVIEPLTGAPFTHVHVPEKMYFLGHVSPASQPDAYSTAVSSLVEHCRRHFPAAPLVVNTMGWVAGIGLSLLVDVIRWTSPTDLIQLTPRHLPADAEDLAPLDPSVVDRACGWLTARGDCSGPRSFSCHHLPGGTWRARSQAKLKRDAMMLSYLGRNVLNNKTVTPFWLWTTVPYRRVLVPWSSLAVHDCDNIARKQDLLHVISGRMVALCVVPRELLLETNKADCPKFMKATGPYECLGYGLVRAVDPAEKVFYIFSPEPRDRLAQVNALITGDIHLPDAVLFSQAQMFRQKTLPYVERNLVSSDEEEQELSGAGVGDGSNREEDQGHTL
ncbi:unnamed protein product [Ixodes hexagonus]